MAFEGNPGYQCDLPPIDFIAMRGRSVQIGDQAAAGEMLDKAFAMLHPVIIEAVVDPLTAMLPRKITATQALRFSSR